MNHGRHQVTDLEELRIPADPVALVPSDPGVLNPAPERLERQSDSSAEDLRSLRDRALAEACAQAAAECASTFQLPER